jgi:hypothetical protein
MTMTDFTPDVLSEPPDEPVVHWMERPPMSVGAAGLTGALAGAFMLGIAVTLAAVVVGRLLESDDDHEAVVLRRVR